jgi:hypothetical protein
MIPGFVNFIHLSTILPDISLPIIGRIFFVYGWHFGKGGFGSGCHFVILKITSYYFAPFSLKLGNLAVIII